MTVKPLCDGRLRAAVRVFGDVFANNVQAQWWHVGYGGVGPHLVGREVEAVTFGPSPGSQVDTFPRLLPRPRGSGGEGRVRGCFCPLSALCVARKVGANTSGPSPGSLRSPPSPRWRGARG